MRMVRVLVTRGDHENGACPCFRVDHMQQNSTITHSYIPTVYCQIH